MSAGPRTVQCPLCGHSFEPTEECAGGSCPLARRCNRLCCPRCRYTFIGEDSTIVRWFRSLLGETEA